MGTDRGLTAKQAAFVREYLVDLNATQAAERAGYSAATAQQMGAENLSKPLIREAIEAGKAARAARTEVTADEVIRILLHEATADDGAMCKTGRVKAAELLGKHLGMFAERTKVEVTGDVTGYLAMSLERYRRQGLAEKLGDE
jgi:phage terminase small subunit